MVRIHACQVCDVHKNTCDVRRGLKFNPDEKSMKSEFQQLGIEVEDYLTYGDRRSQLPDFIVPKEFHRTLKRND